MAPHRGLPPYHTTRIDHKGSEASEAAKTWKTSFGCFAGFLSVFTCCVLHPGGCAGSGHRAQQPNDAGGAAILPGNEAAPNGKNLGDPGQAKQGHPGVPGRPGSEDRLPAQPVKADGAKGGHGGEPHYRAAKAAEEALADSGLKAEKIDLILVATSSSETVFPNTSCEVQKAIGAVHAWGYDLNAACSGFILALNTAQSYIRSGLVKTALVIGAEKMSRIVDWKDRGTCILFGDGAGAVVLRGEESESAEAVYTAMAHSAGDKGEALTLSLIHI